MEKSKLLCFGCLTIALLGLFQGGPVAAFDGDSGFDGGIDDGGFDGGGFDDEGLDDGVDGGVDSGPDEMAEADEDDDGERDDQGDEDKGGHTPGGHRGYGHHHGHGHHGRGRHTHIIYGWPAFGYGPAFGFGSFGYMPPPYYAYPRGSYRPAQPPVVYIEKNEASRGSPPQTYWYYCRDPEGYYPDVEECPDGWEQVLRQPKQDNQE